MNLTPEAFRGYDRKWLSADIIAGVTLAAVAIPEVMGYTSIAQTPLVTGLYTIILPTLFFALLGSSRLLVVGADSATAAVLAAGLTAMSISGLTPDSPEWVSFCSLTALVCGGLLVLARVFKLGFIGDFLSASVLIGFLTGVGIQVFTGQIPDMLGVPKTGSNWFEQQLNTIKEIPDTSLPTFAYALATVAIIFLCEKFAPKIPGAVIAVVGCIVVSSITDAKNNGVAVVGSVPKGFPPIGWPTGMTLHDMWMVLGTAFSCFVLIVAQSAATSRSFAAKHGESVDINRDIVGLSAASFGAGLSGTFVVNGSPTKTQILNNQGGRTQVANITMSAIALLFTLFFTGLLTNMPKSTLAGIVFMIGVSLIDVPGMRRIRAGRSSEFWVALLTCVVVFAVGVEQGIVLAIVASIIEIIRRAYRPDTFVIRDSSTGQPQYLKATPGSESRPGLIVFRFDAELFYANAGRFADDVKAMVAKAPHPVTNLVVDASSLGDVDYSASLQLKDLVAYLQQRHVAVGLAALDPNLQQTLEGYGILGPDSHIGIYPTLADALADVGEPTPSA